MFVEQKILVGSGTEEFRHEYTKYEKHPHAIGKWAPNNTIYLASNTVSLFGEHTIRGFGNFLRLIGTLVSSMSHVVTCFLYRAA